MVVRNRWAPAQIERELQRRHSGKTALAVPNIKTIQRIWRELNPDSAGQWQFSGKDTNPDDARLILKVFRWVREWTDAPVSLTREEAAWIVKLQRSDPGIPPNWTYVLARAYIAAEAAGRSTEFLDDMVVNQAWWTDNGSPSEEWDTLRDERADQLLPFIPKEWRQPAPPDEDLMNFRGFTDIMHGRGSTSSVGAPAAPALASQDKRTGKKATRRGSTA